MMNILQSSCATMQFDPFPSTGENWFVIFSTGWRSPDCNPMSGSGVKPTQGEQHETGFEIDHRIRHGAPGAGLRIYGAGGGGEVRVLSARRHFRNALLQL